MQYEIISADCHIDLPSPGAVTVTWVYRDGADDVEAVLPRAVAALDFPAGSYDVFVHGEAAVEALQARGFWEDTP